jgi:hypothetical protein
MSSRVTLHRSTILPAEAATISFCLASIAALTAGYFMSFAPVTFGNGNPALRAASVLFPSQQATNFSCFLVSGLSFTSSGIAGYFLSVGLRFFFGIHADHLQNRFHGLGCVRVFGVAHPWLCRYRNHAVNAGFDLVAD